MLEAGDYRARAAKAALGLSSNGNEQVGVEFELLDLPGQKITWYGSFASDEAFDITVRGLRAAGFRGNDLADLSSLNDGSAPEVILVVVHETYQGKTRAKVKFINSTGGLAMKNQLTPEQAEAFAKRMKGKFLAFDQRVGTPRSRNGPASRDEGPPIEHLNQRAEEELGRVDDEIPF